MKTITRILIVALVAFAFMVGVAAGEPRPIHEGIGLGLLEPAVRGTQVQVNPPPTTVAPAPSPYAPAGLTGCDEMSWYRQAVGLPEAFDGIGFRESRCINDDSVKTYCCHGWWQMYTSVHVRDHRLAPKMAACGVYSHHDLNSNTPEEKLAQACAAKALYDLDGTDPWSATR